MVLIALKLKHINLPEGIILLITKQKVIKIYDLVDSLQN